VYRNNGCRRTFGRLRLQSPASPNLNKSWFRDYRYTVDCLVPTCSFLRLGVLRIRYSLSAPQPTRPTFRSLQDQFWSSTLRSSPGPYRASPCLPPNPPLFRISASADGRGATTPRVPYIPAKVRRVNTQRRSSSKSVCGYSPPGHGEHTP
jgi:hypothetical protein